MPVNQYTIVAKRLRAVTPSDSTSLDCQALYIGVTGNLSIIADDDSLAVTVSNVPVGIFPVACKKVMAATTASGIVALYV